MFNSELPLDELVVELALYIANVGFYVMALGTLLIIAFSLFAVAGSQSVRHSIRWGVWIFIVRVIFFWGAFINS